MLKLAKAQIFIRNKTLFTRSLSTIINDKVEGFNALSAAWWDFNGSMKQMHLAHPHQMAFIRHQLTRKSQTEVDPQRPLTGCKIADVGCGVGMNSEGLALMGAEVTGMDPAVKTIEVATAHTAANPKLEGRLRYLVSTAEDHVLTHNGQYDAVVAFFILEHIRNRQEFIDNCLALLKPNGSLFLENSNRSFIYFCYILWHTHVTKLFRESLQLFRNKFVTHEEVIRLVNKGHKCELIERKGYFWPLSGQSYREIDTDKFCNFYHFVQKK